MSKKLNDLTDKELALICKKYHDCTREDGVVTCPLWYARTCLRGEIRKNRYLQQEVSL